MEKHKHKIKKNLNNKRYHHNNNVRVEKTMDILCENHIARHLTL